MAVFKCKMCGGALEVNSGESVAVCDYCGTKQTLPKTDDGVVANLFNRANNLRLKCEFDKAEAIYEKILEQYNTEAEAHWGIILCKYGIEYVEDPKTFERIPTCHRTSYESITASAEYLAALEHADSVQREVYEHEAKAIDSIQKNILSIVKNEKPFDVFICYKETDENGKRTVDSAIANDIYYQLTQEGFKVFYAAITLEDKLGQEYEPYIFAALNSAKVMLAIGTKPEYFEAVWVKNEWSRFMNLMKTDRSKLLIPCYKDMDAYDLPEDFAHLQAQDMGKIGFINDVVRGIKKVIVKEEPKETAYVSAIANVSAPATNAAPLLKRAFIFLEDEEWESADEYCEKVLDLDAENAEAYLGKLLAGFEISTKEELRDLDEPFDDDVDYKKVIRFGDKNLCEELKGYNRHIRERNELNYKNEIYNAACNLMDSAISVEDYMRAAEKFGEVLDFKEAKTKKAKCFELVGIIKNKKENGYELIKKLEWYDKNAKNISVLAEKLNSETTLTEKELLTTIDKISSMQTQISKLKDDKKALSFFNMSRKTEIDKSIHEINKEIFLLEEKEQELIQVIKNEIVSELKQSTEGKMVFNKYKFLKISDPDKDYACFGRYVQNNKSYEKDSIEWIVLDEKDTKLLLVSANAVSSRLYADSLCTNWHDCALRKWLNDDFLSKAFNDKEQKMILTTQNRNLYYNLVSLLGDYECGDDYTCKRTEDKIFLLSVDEVEKYFPSKDSRECKINNKKYDWWLRSTDERKNHAVCVDSGGYFIKNRVDGGFNKNILNAVRPAMWIDLSLVE